MPVLDIENTPYKNFLSSPLGERIEVRGTTEIISTGQRATFGLTPALSRQREREILFSSVTDDHVVVENY
jgi:hypothetical protein